MSLLEQTLDRIGEPDTAAMQAAKKHQLQLAIPSGSLGRLHDFNVRLAGITANPRPRIEKLGIVTMAGDHGVAARGVSCFPQEVTREMVANFMRGGAAINVLARHFGIRLTVIDMGVAGPLPDISIENPAAVRLQHCRVADGTRDISRRAAMTKEQARSALEKGILVFKQEFDEGLDAVGTGDMGIANTTPSAAIATVLLQADPGEVVNRGAGIDDAALRHKTAIVRQAIEVNRPDPGDPLDVLAKVGGFEIGGLAGLILGACAWKTPVVVDGFISTAAALLASHFHPQVKNYLFGGHQSAVAGHQMMLEHLGLDPMVNLGMRLGEGTGATYGLAILGSASRVATDMLTFEEAAVTNPGARR